MRDNESTEHSPARKEPAVKLITNLLLAPAFAIVISVLAAFGLPLLIGAGLALEIIYIYAILGAVRCSFAVIRARHRLDKVLATA